MKKPRRSRVARIPALDEDRNARIARMTEQAADHRPIIYERQRDDHRTLFLLPDTKKPHPVLSE